MIDRRRLIVGAAASGLAYWESSGLRAEPLPGQKAATPVPPLATPGEPPRVPQTAPPTSAWINFEYLVSWERMNALQDLVANLASRNITDVTLMISSSGGEISAAISTFNFLRSAGLRLTTYNVGNTYSAALVLFLAGDRRVAAPGSQFIIHPSAAVTTGSLTLPDLSVRMEALDRDASRMRGIIASRTALTDDDLEPMLQKATFINPQDALRWRIANDVSSIVRPPRALLLTLPFPRAGVAAP